MIKLHVRNGKHFGYSKRKSFEHLIIILIIALIIPFASATVLKEIDTKNLGVGHTDGEVMLKCRGTNDCLVTYITDLICAGGGCNTTLFARSFNSTSLGTEFQVDQSNRNSVSGTARNVLCFSKLKTKKF